MDLLVAHIENNENNDGRTSNIEQQCQYSLKDYHLEFLKHNHVQIRRNGRKIPNINLSCFIILIAHVFFSTINVAYTGDAVQKRKPETSFSIDQASVFPSVIGKGYNGELIILPIGSEHCKKPKVRGVPCSGSKKTVKWYFDTGSFECLAFGFNGCNGNENNFNSPAECWERCKLPDMGGCAGQHPPAKNARGEVIICAGEKQNGGFNSSISLEKIANCPPDYKCAMMAFHGICCHIPTQQLYAKNYRPPPCANGKYPIRIESASVPMFLIGKTCSDDFCPAGSVCRQLEVFAHCCPE